jgi:hypothetical protein
LFLGKWKQRTFRNGGVYLCLKSATNKWLVSVVVLLELSWVGKAIKERGLGIEYWRMRAATHQQFVTGRISLPWITNEHTSAPPGVSSPHQPLTNRFLKASSTHMFLANHMYYAYAYYYPVFWTSNQVGMQMSPVHILQISDVVFFLSKKSLKQHA